MAEKVAAFIDLGYLNAITKNLGNLKIDFDRLVRYFIDASKEELYRAYIHYCPPFQSSPPTPEERLMQSNLDKFIKKLKNIPRVEVRMGKLTKTRRGDFIQKRVDTYFAIDLVKLAIKNSIKRAILIAGDSDFLPPILEAKENDVIVKVVYYQDTIQSELFEACDERQEINAEFLNTMRYSFSEPSSTQQGGIRNSEGL